MVHKETDRRLKPHALNIKSYIREKRQNKVDATFCQYGNLLTL